MNGTGYDISLGLNTFNLYAYSAEIGSTPMLTFSFEDGMTWSDFVASDYNREHAVASSSCEYVMAFMPSSGELYAFGGRDRSPYGSGLTFNSDGTVTWAFDIGSDKVFAARVETSAGVLVSLSDKIIADEDYYSMG